MAKTGNYIQHATFTGTVDIANAFANRIDLELADRRLIHGALIIHVDTIAAGATKLTMRITSDTGGDNCIVPDSTADISVGITTATDGSCVWKIDIPIVVESETVSVFLLTDAGTCKCNSVSLTGME